MRHEEVALNRRVRLTAGRKPEGTITDHRVYGGMSPCDGSLVVVEWDSDPGNEILANLEELELIPDPPNGIQIALEAFQQLDE